MLTETVAGRTYDYSHNVGRGAQTGMGFNSPVAMTIGQNGVVYVANRGSESISNVSWNRTGVGQRISKVSLGSASGEEEYIGEFSRYGNGDGQVIWPAGVVTDNDGNLYVADEWLNRITVFDAEGAFQRHFSTVQEGDPTENGSGGIAISPDQTLFVSDGRSHRVRKFSTGGQYLGSFGNQGSGEGEFESPWGLTVDQDGYVYVADSGNHRVQKLTADGQFVAQFGRAGAKRGELHYPSDVAVDPDGDVYVCDWSANRWDRGRVHIFDTDGKFPDQPSRRRSATIGLGADDGRRQRGLCQAPPRGSLH